MTTLMNPSVALLSGWSVWSGAVLVGSVLCVAALLALLAGAVRPVWFSAAHPGSVDSPRFALATGALDGLPLGLAAGLLGGFAFEYLQSLLGVVRFTFASGVNAGLALGIACGALAGFALGRMSRQSSALTLGVLVGLIAGLAVFRIVFGPFAGFGPEKDFGVGPEVGVLCAITGALVGALVASLLRARLAVGSPPRVGRGAAVGAGVGALCGLAGSAALWLTAESTFILPGVAPAYSTAGAAFAGRLYGLALLVILGGLIGALTGALATTSRWRGVSLALTLAIGLLLGLTFGLMHGDVGGPLIATRRFIYDPYGSVYGLAGGLAAGALAGLGVALTLRRAERQTDRRALLVAIALLALSGALMLTPLWFHPLFGVDIP